MDAASIARALDQGQFFASTGVDLDDVTASEDRLTVHIVEQPGLFKYETEFIGSEGTILATTIDNPAVYRLMGGEAFVRAKVTRSDGAAAWVQPHFTRAR